jgi:putative FmdB family regulatory protein
MTVMLSNIYRSSSSRMPGRRQPTSGDLLRAVRRDREDAARVSTVPIYEYVCMSCECHFEELVGMSDPDPVCPECGKEKVAKQFSTSFAAHGTAGQPSFGGGCCGGSCGCC